MTEGVPHYGLRSPFRRLFQDCIGSIPLRVLDSVRLPTGDMPSQLLLAGEAIQHTTGPPIADLGFAKEPRSMLGPEHDAETVPPELLELLGDLRRQRPSRPAPLPPRRGNRPEVSPRRPVDRPSADLEHHDLPRRRQGPQQVVEGFGRKPEGSREIVPLSYRFFCTLPEKRGK